MAQHRPIGYIRQTTVNCDFIVCSRHAKFYNTKSELIETERLFAETIVSPTLDALLENIKIMQTRIDSLQDKVEQLTEGTTGSYTSGMTVASTLHFDDVDLTSESFDLDAYENELRERLAFEAGVEVDQIDIIDLSSTGSATARIEIRYVNTDDPVANEELKNKKKTLMNVLTDPLALGSALSSLGNVQLEEIEENPIQSINSKVFYLEKQLTNFSLEDKKSLLLDNYKFEVEEDELRIKRYDYAIGSYVGGTLVVD